MTTIITTTGNNFATLTADQGITSDLIHPDMPKIVQQDTWLIGVAGSARVCDQLQYAIEYPKPPVEVVKSGEWMKWIVTKVIPLIDYVVKDKEMDAEAILITHGKAFLVGEDLSVLTANPYWAIGSGANLALGSLADKQYKPDWHKNHDLSSLRAIEAASMFDPHTRGTLDQYRSYTNGKVMQRTNGI
jgi:ATP-dependent protease HslVU (ClpYQ) peptidase subunit